MSALGQIRPFNRSTLWGAYLEALQPFRAGQPISQKQPMHEAFDTVDIFMYHGVWSSNAKKSVVRGKTCLTKI